MKKIVSILLCAVLGVCALATLTACSEKREEVLKLYMPGEYIDESIFAEFEDWYKSETGKKVTVKIETFDAVEDIQQAVEASKADYDLLCPSDYMIGYLISKELLIPVDKEVINIEADGLIKQEYHVMGYLFIINANNQITLYFYSNPYYYKKHNEELPLCNKLNEKDNKNNICNGSLFKCSKKEKNKKIKIKFEDIRMILKRIYYYRKSGLEIFTETKSYYFNFLSKKNLNDVISLFENIYQKSYFPITINNNLYGFIKLNKKFIRINSLTKTNLNFIDFILNKISKGELPEISMFDIILFINLISNRSFIDLYQYPIFPLLFFYDKSNNIINIIERDLKEHIGFQVKTETCLKRKILFEQTYIDNIKYHDEEDNYYFNTLYSNIVYTSNYMIRLIPYSFCAIELQGDGFDDPNRLFSSIEDTFHNISSQKSDLRELIPEFFYLPEMFINFSSVNFNKKTDGNLVDDIIMPNNISSNINLIMNENNENSIKYFMFVNFMKDKLESMKDSLNFWLNIIFGEEQQYNKIKEQYFRNASYIDIDDETYNKYSNDKIIMSSVDFGLIPLQTIFDNKFIQKQNEKNKKENIKMGKKQKFINDANKDHIHFNNIINNYIEKNILYNLNENNIYEYIENDINVFYIRDNKYKINFKINTNDNYGKLIIYENEIFKKEIIDHNEKIIDIFYNFRLNMFATSSYDGLACIYMFPNKLFSIIRHPKNRFFNKIYLSSNPFPTIITYESLSNTISSYSLSGILINQKILDKNNSRVDIIPIFDIYGGVLKDKIKIIFKSIQKIKIFNLPFFDEEK